MTEKYNTMPIELLRQVLDYNPESGALTWKNRPREWFSSDRIFRSWNNKYAGTPALSHQREDGYFDGRIFKKHFRKHRVIWAIVNGEWPKEVDHEDHAKGNNAHTNLRSVSRVDNSKNRALRKDNTSNVCGVCWHKAARKWVAQISINQRNSYLGIYSSRDEAIAVRRAGEIENGYHPNHGVSNP